MRKWGVLISVFYALVVLGVLVPAAVFLFGVELGDWTKFRDSMISTYKEKVLWIPIGAVLVGQILLLLLSVDTSWQRLKPRAHILVSTAVAGMLVALLTFAVVLCLRAGFRGDEMDRIGNETVKGAQLLSFLGFLWLSWALVFFMYLRNSSAVVTRIMSWLLKGSVLELLVAVPCHVIVRRRHECSAPLVTSFGIATGIAVMLLSFGPSVLLLFKKRLDGYRSRATASE